MGLLFERGDLSILNYDVAERTVHDPSGAPIPDFKQIYRVDTGRNMGIVGSDYQIIQSRELADIVSMVPGKREGKEVEACTFGGGVIGPCRAGRKGQVMVVKKQEVLADFGSIGKYRIRVIAPATVDIREWVVGENYEGFTRKGVRMNRAQVVSLRNVLQLCLEKIDAEQGAAAPASEVADE